MAEIFEMPNAEEETGWYSNDAATFGDRVAAARDAAGLSQEALAKRMGIKLKTIQNWEDDLNEPRANKLQMLSGVLNVSLMWLLNGEGEGIDAPDTAEISTDMSSILAELRLMRVEATRAAARVARLEKRLRKALATSDT